MENPNPSKSEQEGSKLPVFNPSAEDELFPPYEDKFAPGESRSESESESEDAEEVTEDTSEQESVPPSEHDEEENTENEEKEKKAVRRRKQKFDRATNAANQALVKHTPFPPKQEAQPPDDGRRKRRPNAKQRRAMARADAKRGGNGGGRGVQQNYIPAGNQVHASRKGQQRNPNLNPSNPGSNAVADNRPPYNCRFPLGKKQIEHIEQYTLPGRKVVLQPSDNPHSHPISAIERRVAESWIVREARTFAGLPACSKPLQIVDIGGSPTRHLHANRTDVWSCNPIISSDDAIRCKKFERLVNAKMCNHKAEICNCVMPDIYISIHSIYYINPSIILDMLGYSTLHTMFIAVHRFQGLEGTVCAGELAWKRTVQNGVDMVISRVRHGSVYRHNACDWIERGYYQDMDPTAGPRAMACQAVQTFGDTHIYMLTITPVIPQPDDGNDVQTLTRRMLACDYYGQLDESAIAAEAKTFADWSKEKLPTATYWSFGDYLMLSLPRNKEVVVPKQTLAALRTFAAFKTRDTQMLHSLADKAKQLLRDTKLSAERIQEAVVPLVFLAFVSDVEYIGDELGGLAARHNDAFRDMNLMLQHPTEPLTTNYKLWLIAVAAAAVATWGAATYFKYTRMSLKPRSKYADGYSDYLESTTGSMWLWNLGVKLWNWVWNSRAKARAFLAVLLSGVQTASVYGSFRYAGTLVKPTPLVAEFPECEQIKYHGKRYYPTICTEFVPLKPLGKGSKIKVPRMGPCTNTFGTVQLGPGLASVLPVIPRNCVHTEITALRNRALMEQQFDHEAWDATRVITGQYFDQLFPPVPHFRITFTRWTQRFPPSRRKSIRDGYSTYQAVGIINSHYGCRTFIKRERLPKCIAGQSIDVTARVIQGNHDEYMAVMGPWLYGDAKYLGMVWDYRTGHSITYAAGLNAHDSGRWFDYANNTVTSPVQFMNDASRWDGNICRDAIELLHEVIAMRTTCWSDTRITNNFVHMLNMAQLDSFGTTFHGIKYFAEGRVQSGRLTTSSGNSTLNALIHIIPMIMILHRMPTQQEFMMLVMGDDMYVVITGAHMRKYRELLRPFLTRLGIVHRCQFFHDMDEAQFCSSRWWPTKHGHVLGPKPFRALSKTFHCQHQLNTSHQSQWLRGVVLGWRNDANHVPVMRVVIERMLKLTSGRSRYYDADQRPHAEKIEVADELAMATMCDKIYPGGYAAIKMIETIVAGMKNIPCTIHSKLLPALISSDINDPIVYSLASLWLHPSQFMLGIFSPVAEEVIKRWRIGVIIIMLIEFSEVVYISMKTGSLIPIFGKIPALIFVHLLPHLKGWDYLQRLFFHACWNNGVIFTEAVMILGARRCYRRLKRSKSWFEFVTNFITLPSFAFHYRDSVVTGLHALWLSHHLIDNVGRYALDRTVDLYDLL